jgi:hypothetical protein
MLQIIYWEGIIGPIESNTNSAGGSSIDFRWLGKGGQKPSKGSLCIDISQRRAET